MAPDYRHRRRADHDDTSKPVLITAARESYQDELSARKKRYFLLMSIRIPALLLAAGALALWDNPWIAMAIVVGSIPIPWIAVIGANDRPPLSKEEARSYMPNTMTMPTHSALPPGIRGDPAGSARQQDEPSPDEETRAEENPDA